MESKIEQKGSGHQASIGKNAPVTRGKSNNINILAKAKYFFSGVIVSIVAAIIFEFILKGKISTILIRLTDLIQKN